jgi:FkbM family methyltransferase
MNSKNQPVPLEDTFVSYAQNFEDVMLWRALKHIKDGFYVDVGANDPVFDSVTKAFYDRGWTGINIEPCKSVYDRLTELRPKDINLKQLVGSSESQATFFEFSDTGRSTMDRHVAELFRAQGNEVQETSVSIKPLDQILDESAVQTIHFLKIDVEGAEKSVLEGALFTKHRPWVLVIESTIPGLPAHNHDAWEALVVTKDYEFVYDDGLNRFYVAAECTDLKGHFKYPPNFFDGFVSSSEIELRNRSEGLLNVNEQLRVRNNELSWALRKADQSLLYKLGQIVRHLKKYMCNSK